jgi:hypothetical protein
MASVPHSLINCPQEIAAKGGDFQERTNPAFDFANPKDINLNGIFGKKQGSCTIFLGMPAPCFVWFLFRE